MLDKELLQRGNALSPPTLFQAMPSPRLGCEGPSHVNDGQAERKEEEMSESSFTQALHCHVFTPASEAPAAKESELPQHECIRIFVQHEDSAHPMPCKVDNRCTAGILTQAEASLGSLSLPIAPRSLVGTHLPLGEPLQENQHVMLFQNFPPSTRCPFESTRFCWHHQNHVRLPCTRLEALWRQQAWVATDEMNYYLTATQVHNRANPFPTTMFLHEADASEMAMEWLAIALSTTDDTKAWCSATIIAGHWVPVVIKHEANLIQFHTTPEGSCLLQPASQIMHDQNKTIEITQTLLPQAFAADCGFQALEWILATLNDAAPTAVPATTAAQETTVCT